MREENKTELFKKLIAISGDIGEDNLGLSNEDRSQLIENVQIVVHSAATLDFEVSLKNAVLINLLGTRRVIQLCQEIKNLKVSQIVEDKLEDILSMNIRTSCLSLNIYSFLS